MKLEKDSNIKITDEKLSAVLGDSFSAYKALIEKLPEFETSLIWRFYKDGGWLAKLTWKKKTIFWGEAADCCFNIAFHFNEKNKHGVSDLEITNELKQLLLQTQPQGKRKLTTLKIKLCSENQLSDIYQLINYKKREK